MTIVLRRGVMTALAAGLLVLSACSSDRGGATDGSVTVHEPTVSEGPTYTMGTTETMTTPPPANVSMWTPPTAQEVPPSSGNQDPFSRIQEERTLVQQRNALLAESFITSARRHFQEGNLEDAEAAVMQAINVSPANQEALDLLRQIRITAGDEVAELDDIGVYVQNRAQLARQAQVARVNDHYAKANAAFNEGDYQGAVTELTNADLIMRFDAYQTDFGSKAEQVPQMLAAARNKLEQKNRMDKEGNLRDIWERQREEDLRERKREREMAAQLMVRAVESYVREDFDQAEYLARRVLEAEPGLVEAKELLEATKNARNAVWRRDYGARRRERYQRWLEGIRETQIPYTALLTWPDREEWAALTKSRRDALSVATTVNDTDGVRAIKAKLRNESITLDYGPDGAPLSEVARRLRTTFDINVILDSEVALEHGETPVIETFVDHNLGAVLKTVLNNMDLAYTFRDDALVITTKEKALGQPVPKVYEVRDMTIALPNFKAPSLTLRSGGAGEATARAVLGEPLDPTIETEIDTLVELIRTTIKPETWDLPGFGISPSSGQIVATTTPDIHDEVDSFLNSLRQFNKLSVHVEARFISMRQGYLQDFGIDFRDSGGQNPGTIALLEDITNAGVYNAGGGVGNSGPGLPAAAALSPASGLFYPMGGNGDLRGRTEGLFDRGLGDMLSATGGARVVFSILDDLQIGAVLHAVEKDVNTTLVNAPRLTIYNNQRANLTLVNQITYVKDYDVEVAQTAFIADPLVDVIQDGLTLDVRPTVSYDRKYVSLEVQPSLATLVRPIRTFESNLSGLTTPVIIELPEIRFSQAATTVKVPDGGYVVIGGLKNITTVDRRSEVPILSDIPLISTLFSRKGRSDEIRDLMIVLHVRILDLTEMENDMMR